MSMEGYFLVSVVPRHGPTRRARYRSLAKAEACFAKMEKMLGEQAALGVGLHQVETDGRKQAVKCVLRCEMSRQLATMERLKA